MAKYNVVVEQVFICSTNPRVCHFDKDLIWAYFASRTRLSDLPILGSFEDVEGNHFKFRV